MACFGVIIVTHVCRQAALERQALSCTYLAHHELRSVVVVTILSYYTVVVIIIIAIIVVNSYYYYYYYCYYHSYSHFHLLCVHVHAGINKG